MVTLALGLVSLPVSRDGKDETAMLVLPGKVLLEGVPVAKVLVVVAMHGMIPEGPSTISDMIMPSTPPSCVIVMRCWWQRKTQPVEEGTTEKVGV